MIKLLKIVNEKMIIKYKSGNKEIIKSDKKKLEIIKKIINENEGGYTKKLKYYLLKKFNFALGMREENDKYIYSFIAGKYTVISIKLSKKHIDYLREKNEKYFKFYFYKMQKSDKKKTIINKEIYNNIIKKNSKKIHRLFFKNIKYENLNDKLYTITYTKKYNGKDSYYNIQDNKNNNIVNLIKYCKSKNYNSYYERLKKDVKLYFDIEKKLLIDKWNSKELIKKYEKYILKTFINDLKKIMLKYSEVKLDEKEIYITKASRKIKEEKKYYWKISYHIVGPNYLYFQSNHKLNKPKTDKQFISVNSPYIISQLMKQLKPDFYNDLIDDSVYSVNRMMRMINSYKGEGNNKLIPVDKYLNILKKYNIKDYIISHKDNYKKLIKFSNDTIEKLREKNKKKNKENIKKSDQIKEFMIKKNISDELIKKSLFQKIEPYGYYKDYNNGYYEIVKNNKICISGRSSCRNNYYVKIDNNGQFILNCFSQKCKEKITKNTFNENKSFFPFRNLGYVDELEPEFKNCSVVNTKYILEKDKNNNFIIDCKEKEDTSRDYYKIKKVLNDFINNNERKGLIIKSSMGCGKTCSGNIILSRLIKKLKSDLLKKKIKKNIRILNISYRVSLGNQFEKADYVKFKFHNYLELQKKKINLNSVDRLNIQLESIWKLSNSKNFKPYDIIILDETESLLKQLAATTVKNKSNVWKTLKTFLKYSKKIISFDALASHRTKILLDKFNYSCILNKTQTLERNIKFFYGFKKTSNNIKYQHNKIIKLLKEKKNILVSTLSKNHCKTLQQLIIQRIKNIKVLAIHSESDEKIKKIKSTEWKNYNCVIFTPTIEAGININYDHFYKMFGFINSNSATPEAYYQICGRARKLFVKEIIITINSKGFPIYSFKPFYSKKQIEKYLYNHNKNIKQNEKLKSDLKDNIILYKSEEFFKHMKKKYIFDKEKEEIILEGKKNKYNEIQIYNFLDECNKSQDVFINKFIYICEKGGWNVEIINKLDKDILLKEFINPEDNKICASERDILLKRNLLAKEIIENLEKKKKLRNENITQIDKENIIYYNKINRGIGLTKDLPEHKPHDIENLKKKINYYKSLNDKEKINQFSLRDILDFEIFRNKNDFKALFLRYYIHMKSGENYESEYNLYLINQWNQLNGIKKQYNELPKKIKEDYQLKFRAIDDLLKFFNLENLNNFGKIIKYDKMKKLMEKILKESLYYKNFEYYKILFNSKRAKKPKTFKGFMKQIKFILNKIGILIFTFKKHNYNKNYIIVLDKNICSVLRWKKNSGQDIKGYSLIEKEIIKQTEKYFLFINLKKYSENYMIKWIQDQEKNKKLFPSYTASGKKIYSKNILDFI